MPGFQTRALVVIIIFRLIPPYTTALSNVYQTNFWSVRYTRYYSHCTEQNILNSVGSLFFRDRILRFGKNMPQSLKRFLSNFNVVAIQNSLDGFRNTLNVRNNSKTSRWFPFIKSVTICNWFLAVTEKSFCIAICLQDIGNIFPLLSLRIE